jgi:hypothetical protein
MTNVAIGGIKLIVDYLSLKVKTFIQETSASSRRLIFRVQDLSARLLHGTKLN